MTKTINTTFALTLIAASVFGGSAAFAGGSYYEGVFPRSEDNRKVDTVRTNSIDGRYIIEDRGSRVKVGPANGDYYPGVDRNAR